MASQILDVILETEKKCDERIKAARNSALETAAAAEQKAAGIKEKAKLTGEELSAEITADAQKKAAQITEEGRKKALAQAEAMREQAKEKYELASKAVASLLLKIS